MLQFPGFMTQYPWSTRTIPTSFLLPSQWPQPHSEELLLAMEESDFEDKVFQKHPNWFPVPFLIHLRIWKRISETKMTENLWKRKLIVKLLKNPSSGFFVNCNLVKLGWWWCFRGSLVQQWFSYIFWLLWGLWFDCRCSMVYSIFSCVVWFRILECKSYLRCLIRCGISSKL